MLLSMAAKSASNLSNICVMAGVSWEDSILVNLGKASLSRRGFDVAGASAVEDMARAVLVLDGQDADEEVTVVRAR